MFLYSTGQRSITEPISSSENLLMKQKNAESFSILAPVNYSGIINTFLCIKLNFRYLMSKGARVDQIGGDLNSTPMHWATRYILMFIRNTCIF